MRELFLVEHESTDEVIVLSAHDGERFSLPRTALSALSLIDDSPDPETEAQPVEFDAAPEHSEHEHAEHTEPAVSAETEHDTEADRTEAREPRPLPEPDPLYAKPLSLRPSEIQQRIRAGATAQELADEMGVAVSRIDAYAHPVLLERQQVAETAKRSHPLREDGPAKLSLFEILATAFAARGHSLTEATWDAVREPGDDWVVRVSWKAGLSDNTAEWSFHRAGMSATTEARNPIAADLTDPDFVQPVRSLTAVTHLRGRDEDDFDEPDFDHDHQVDAAPEGTEQDDNGPATKEEVYSEGDFLKHPEPAQEPTKRKRKAVTPHWEDVLLGVRTNTKRPRK